MSECRKLIHRARHFNAKRKHTDYRQASDNPGTQHSGRLALFTHHRTQPWDIS